MLSRMARKAAAGPILSTVALFTPSQVLAEIPADAQGVQERPFPTQTAFVRNGKPGVLIIHGKETVREAQALRRQLRALCRVDFPPMVDTQATGGKRWTLRDEVKRRSLLVLGNINNNRAVLALYAQFLAAANGRFPGKGRYVIRHLAEPFVPGRTAILVGASDGEGLQTGVTRLIQVLKDKTAAHGPALPLPFLEFGDRDGPTRIPRGDHRFRDIRDAAYVFYTNGAPPARYPWYAVRSPEAAWDAGREMLLKIVGSKSRWYPCGGHYQFIYNYQALRILLAHGILNRSELRDLEEKLLSSALTPQDHYAKHFLKHALRPKLDDRVSCKGVSRHTSSAVVGHWLLLDYLARFCPMSEPHASQVKRAHRGFTQMIEHWNKNRLFRVVTDPKEALDCSAFMIYAYMQMGLEDFVDNGILRNMAWLYFASSNNLWTDSGLSDYIGAYNGSHLRSPSGGLAVRTLAFFTGDRSLEWLRTQKFEQAGTYRRGFNDRSNMCLDQPSPFSLPVQPDPGPPTHLVGFMRVPIDPYLWRTRYAEERRTSSGGISHGRAYDAMAFRESWDADGASLVMAGVQGTRADTPSQLHTLGGYTELGARFLFGNTFTRAKWHRTGVSVDAGRPCKEGSLATVEACVNGPEVYLLTSRAREHNGTVWDRTIVRRKDSYTVVMDDLTATEAGDFLFTATWRILPAGGADEAGVFKATAPNGTTFTLQPARRYRHEVDRPSLDGGSRPTFLRQYQTARLGPGQAVHFQNLLKAENATRRVPCDVRVSANGRAVVIRDLGPSARHALAGTGRPPAIAGLPTGEVTSYYVSADIWALGGVKRLSFRNEPLLSADRPVNVLIHFDKRELSIDVPAGTPVTLDLSAPLLGQARRGVTVPAGRHEFRLALGPGTGAEARIVGAPTAAQDASPATSERTPRLSALRMLWALQVQDAPARILRPVTIRSTPQPISMPDQMLHDGFMSSSTLGPPSWKSDQVDFLIDRGATGDMVTGLRVSGGVREYELFESRDRVHFEPVRFESTEERVYVGYSRTRVGSDCFGAQHLAFGSNSRYLRLRCRGIPSKSLHVREIQVLGTPAPDEVWGRLTVTPLRRNGQPVVLCRTGQTLDTVEKAGAITTVGLNGEVQWKQEDPGPAQYREKYWVTGDITGDGNHEIMTYSDANVLNVYSHDGRLLRSVDIAKWETERNPRWSYDRSAGGKSIALWPRAADGTSYAYIFGHVHHYRLKLFPKTEIEYRNRMPDWNCAPAASVPVPGWTGPGKQNLVGIAPYEPLVALWEDLGPDKPPHVAVTRSLGAGKPSGNNQLPAFVEGQLAANPLGVVVATPAIVHFYEGHKLESRWKIPHAVPVSALTVADLNADGKDEALVGQANGRVLTYDVASGELLRQTLLTGRVKQILPIGNGRVLVGTHDGLTLLDAEFRNAGQMAYPLEDVKVWLGNGVVQVFLLGRDGLLRSFEFSA